MAMAQAYPQAYMQQTNKGTLLPGQTIAVNKYTVQVERYLSQGGFAHVYLVRTATPVFNTTSHVLKRIAVPNEAMLTEVKKEVDIMRILKGHPNIVYLIDAAWHRLPNGTYEVFILMEYCAGGGIIDMMNRRLRERLTEPEILTIFCDVCEGLAAMHALKPPLLHRDLKVENILQASSTLYKLCDFGSATPVQKVPTNAQEMRALEADLNRHTTLQYRAPEMVDVYLRRPVDEKSDVWALGVLLYKLCYYTTPFEEHGPLAILNVQYKIPPYPVYSNQMNALIASMLREHGAQRPTVFEVLEHVHKLRGTKSRFSYPIPAREPPLSPRAMVSPPLQTLSPNIIASTQQVPNPLDDLVSYKSNSPSKGAGIEARDRVLEAIAPMRRGRPPLAMPSPPASPKKERAFELDMKFSADEDRAWRGVRGHKSGLASFGGSRSDPSKNDGDAWGLATRTERRTVQDSQTEENGKEADKKIFEKAFGDDFTASFGKSFGDSFQPARSPGPSQMASQPQPVPSPNPQPQPTPSPRPQQSSGPVLSRHQSMRKPKDAFDGLGLSAAPPPQTLGEARKTRTGIAGFAMSTGFGSGSSSAAAQYLNTSSSQTSGLGTSNTTYRPPSAHSPLPTPSPQPGFQSQSISPDSQPWRSQFKAPPSSQGQSLTAEERFPSLEELDREFGSPSPSAGAPTGRDKFGGIPAHAPTQPPSTERLTSGSRPPSRASYIGNVNMRLTGVEGLPGMGAGGSGLNGINVTGAGKGRYDGVRSQNVTGTAMAVRESRFGGVSRQQSMFARLPPTEARREIEREKEKEKERQEKEKDVVTVLRSRPSAARRHKHSSGTKTPSRGNSTDLLSPPTPSSASTHTSTPALPPRPQPASRGEAPRDWLTGADDESSVSSPPLPSRAESQSQPVLRDSPSKRASYIERSPLTLQKPLEAESVMGSYQPDPEKPARREMKWGLEDKTEMRENTKEDNRRRSPERAKAFAKLTGTGTGTGAGSAAGGYGARRLPLPPVDTKAASRSDVKPSPNGLTENWSPVAQTSVPPVTAKSSSSSSSEEGPEDLQGYGRDVKERGKGPERTSTEEKRRRAKAKGRQSSVHDLVDLWDGGKEQDKDKEKSSVSTIARQAEKRRSVIMPAPTLKPPPLVTKPRPESPQPLVETSSTSSVSSRILQSSQPPASPHRRQASKTPAGRPMPAPSPAPAPMSNRSRPQSMFLTSSLMSKSSSTETNASASSSSTTPGSASTTHTLLPPTDPHARRSTRRSSISDMVQRYEAIGGGAKGQGVAQPAIAPASTGLNVKVKPVSGESGMSVPSPSAAAVRFPKLSPSSSPVMSKASLVVPADAGSRDSSSWTRTSPTGLPSRTSPIGRHETPSFGNSRSNTERSGAINGLPGRRSPVQLPRHEMPATSTTQNQEPTSPFPLRKPTLPVPAPVEDPVRSPSPERPYVGVSKLIDRWNRAVDDSGTAPPVGVGVKRGGVPARKVGVVGGESGRER